MANYRLSEKADQDLDDIFLYSFESFGLEKADDYLDSLITRLHNISNSPMMYPEAQDVQRGIRCSVHSPHTIYYRLIDKEVEIIRILRQQDVTKAIP
jgi:toxin ParE1/3/4